MEGRKSSQSAKRWQRLLRVSWYTERQEREMERWGCIHREDGRRQREAKCKKKDKKCNGGEAVSAFWSFWSNLNLHNSLPLSLSHTHGFIPFADCLILFPKGGVSQEECGVGWGGGFFWTPKCGQQWFSFSPSTQTHPPGTKHTFKATHRRKCQHGAGECNGECCVPGGQRSHEIRLKSLCSSQQPRTDKHFHEVESLSEVRYKQRRWKKPRFPWRNAYHPFLPCQSLN